MLSCNLHCVIMEKPQTHLRTLFPGMICCVVGSLTYFDILKECSAFILRGGGWLDLPTHKEEVAAFLKRTLLSYL